MYLLFFFKNAGGSFGRPRGSDISINGLYSFPGSIPGGKRPNDVSKPNTISNITKNINYINKGKCHSLFDQD